MQNSLSAQERVSAGKYQSGGQAPLQETVTAVIEVSTTSDSGLMVALAWLVQAARLQSWLYHRVSWVSQCTTL